MLRLASQRAKEIIGNDHPFSTGRFRSFGNAILTDVALETGESALLDILKSQLAFKRIIAPYLRGLEFEGDEPVRWFPTTTNLIVIDPHRSFGQPVLKKEGVPTLVLAKAYKVERSFKTIARWFELPTRSVKAAIEFERRHAA